jgi:formylglycine-generating enzyme required for sulfatase activity/poly(3-hydroxybutyrate) depolymerase
MTAPSFLSRSRWSFTAFVLLAIAACGARSSGTSPSSGSGEAVSSGASAGAVSGASSGTSVANSGVSSGAATTGLASGASAAGVSTGAVASGSAGRASGTGSGTTVVAADAGPDGGGPSAGCGKAWTGATGIWVSQPTGCAQGINNQGTSACQAIPPGSTVPATATSGSPEYRGWWVYVPTGYDPSKPYTVIYNGAGCGVGNYLNAGEDGYPYDTVDNGQAILVGLDYDTYSDVPGCYDNRDPQSNDFTFFPWLQSQIESDFCVDTSHEFFSGYASGAQLAQQLNCAFPNKLRGFASVTGCEPGAPAFPGAQYSPCVSKPTAAFFVKDFDDTDNTYACILPACARVLAQNGCTTTTCNPLDTTTTTPYVVPKGVTPPAGTKCVSFNGCPADYPVVFCITYNQDHSDDQNWGVVPLFWDWMSQLDSSLCPAGKVYQNGACAPCPAGETACGVACVDEQTDSNNCGFCGTQCLVGSSCQSGSCSCPGGQTKCNGVCVSEPTDPGNCGACATRCRGDAPFCYQGTCTTPPSSCQPGGLGMSNCGANSESCCTSLEVTGGTYYRTYDARSLQGVPDVAPDGGPTDLADPATVSSFRLDKYLVTVGRFRQFVTAVLPRDGGAGWLPPPGSGKHTHLNGGNGLVATGGAFEPGWLASDDANIAPTDSNLTANGAYATWTSSPGEDENLPVTDANWYEAYAFCIWDGGFLPSDAESEYAAAGGAQQREYPWGATPPGTANDYAIFGDGNGLCYFTSGGTCAVAPVGYAAQGAGLFGQLDLAGDLWEWNLDWLADYVDPCVDCADMTVVPVSAGRAVRGGNFAIDASNLLSPYRDDYGPVARSNYIGFRCARAP